MTTYNENQKYKALLRAVADYWFANGQDSTLDRYMISYSGRDWKIAIAEQRAMRQQRAERVAKRPDSKPFNRH